MVPFLPRPHMSMASKWNKLMQLTELLGNCIMYSVLSYIYLAYIIVIKTCDPLVSLHLSITWWRHQMETFSALLVLCAGIHRSPVNSPHKGQWRGAFMFSLICTWINGWVNSREAGDLRCYCAHYDVTIISYMHMCSMEEIFTLCW